MTDERMVKVQEIRERIARREYAVDARLVAAAIVERLLAGGTVWPADDPQCS